MSATHVPLLRRMLLRVGTLLLTVAFMGGAGALVVLGTDSIAARAEKAPASNTMPPIPVRVAEVARQESYQVTAEYQGRIEARRRVDLGFETGGTVAEILADEGQALTKGDVVARLDTRALTASRLAEVAQRDALAAEAELARLTADRQKALLDQNHVARQRYDEARLGLTRIEAQVAAADAAITAIDVALSKTVLTAPFDATVGTRHLDEGTAAGAGQAVLSLIEARAPEFKAGIPADLAANVEVGAHVTVILGNETREAKITGLREDIDPATRTVEVTLDVDGAGAFPDGTLGRLLVARNVAGTGAWVPTAALTEGLRGLWNLYTVDNTDGHLHARREAVELIHIEGTKAFVRGALTDGEQIVADGPHRIADGQPVTPEG